MVRKGSPCCREFCDEMGVCVCVCVYLTHRITGAPYCTPDPSNFYDQTVGIVSPVFDFSAVASSDNIFLRFWAWMFGLRTGTLTVELTTSGSIDGPWQSPPLAVIGLGDNRWTEHLVELVGMQGQPAVRLRFYAHFLNRSCSFTTCGSGDSTPPPEDMVRVVSHGDGKTF